MRPLRSLVARLLCRLPFVRRRIAAEVARLAHLPIYRGLGGASLLVQDLCAAHPFWHVGAVCEITREARQAPRRRVEAQMSLDTISLEQVRQVVREELDRDAADHVAAFRVLSGLYDCCALALPHLPNKEAEVVAYRMATFELDDATLFSAMKAQQEDRRPPNPAWWTPALNEEELRAQADAVLARALHLFQNRR